MTYKIAVLLNGAPGPARESARVVEEALRAAGHQVAAYEADDTLAATLRATKPQVVFNGVEGKLGAALSELCELLEIPVIGSGVAARRKAVDASELPRALGGFYAGFDGCASAVDGVVLDRVLFERAGVAAVLDTVADKVPAGYPLAVKPARGAAGMGVAHVEDLDQLREALPLALALDEHVVIQEWVEGVRLSVSVLGDIDDPYTLPPVEIAPLGDGTADFYAPVRLESLSADETMAQAIRSEVERAAVEAVAALGCRDLACVDIVWDGARAKVIQVDADPALGEGSLFMKGCQVAGIGLDALLAELLTQALYHK